VPGQEPDSILAAVTQHVHAHCPVGVEVTVEGAPGAVPAYAIAADHPAVRAALLALRTVYPDSETLLVRIGGTLPAASLFERILGLKTVLFSFSTADEQLHAPNEFFRLSRLEEGLRAWAELWRLLALDETLPLLE
jgi:acetylornithine deacetylase/succinyl-diaminopimelate desuccinylase-like protein